MHAIVPLAGPEFVRQDNSLKALSFIEGSPMLQHALQSRSWASAITHYTFVLFDCELTRRFARNYLSKWYPLSSIVYLSSYTRGAALSALGGLSVLPHFNEPLIIDLADIIYKTSLDIDGLFAVDNNIGGIVTGFESTQPHYSYLKTRGTQITEAAEKRVISAIASTGTYIFRDCSVYLRSIVHAFENEQSQSCNNKFYVCPLVNGILAQGLQVILEPVFDVLDVEHDVCV